MNTRWLPLAAVTLLLAGPVRPAAAQFYPGGYGWGWGMGNIDPYGGYMRGSADVINAQGNFIKSRQEASLERERVRQTKVDTRRKVFDNWLYERQATPSVEDERQRTMMNQLRRARNNPPPTEVWSGQALNDLLDNLKRVPASAGLPSVPLDPVMLEHLNVTGGQGDVSIGLLKAGQLLWPAAFRTSDFRQDTAKIDKAVADALAQARKGPVSGDSLRDLSVQIDDLRAKLRKAINDMSPMPYIEARRYLQELDDTVRALSSPSVGNYFTKWQARGRDVAELVQYMTSQGLRFTAATPGDEAAYTALHSALVAFDSGATQLVANPPK